MLGIVAWYSERDGKGVLLDKSGHPHHFHEGQLTEGLKQAGVFQSHIVDFELMKDGPTSNLSNTPFMCWVDLPFKAEADAAEERLRGVYDKNMFERSTKSVRR